MKNNIYKYGFFTFTTITFVLFLYCSIYGAVERAEAFATWMNDGMSVHDARCSMAFDLEVME